MTVIGICVEWLASFLEVALCQYFIRIFSADQFPKKKQRILYFVIASVITTGGILLNLVELSFSMATVLFFCAANVIASCILYKGNAADFAVITIFFNASLNVLDWCLLQVVALIWSAQVISEIQSGFSLLRIGIVAVIKLVETAVYLLLGNFLKKTALRMNKKRLVQFGAVAAFVSSLYLIHTSGIYPDLYLNPIQTVLGIAIIAGLCFSYLF